MKMYDILAGSRRIKSSFLLSKYETLERIPSLNPDKLKGSILYYDGNPFSKLGRGDAGRFVSGQMNDSLLTLAVVLTAARYGATVANYVSACDILQSYAKDEDPCVVDGVSVKDMVSCEVFDVKAKCVINATGPFTDSIRQMDDPYAREMCTASCGIHIVLPGTFSPFALPQSPSKNPQV